jgi:hypothetical protein
MRKKDENEKPLLVGVLTNKPNLRGVFVRMSQQTSEDFTAYTKRAMKFEPLKPNT